MSYNPKFILRFNYIRNQAIHYCLVWLEPRVVNPNIAPSRTWYRNMYTYELNQTLYYNLNKNFIKRIQQIRRGSLWSPNQRGLVAHRNWYHYKII